METPRDRVLASLRNEEPDLCPYYIWIHSKMVSALADHFGDESFQETQMCNHSVMWEIPPLNLSPDEETSTDLFGSVWQWDPERSFAFPNRPVLTGPSLDGYSFPVVDIPETYEGLDAWGWTDTLTDSASCRLVLRSSSDLGL